MLGCLLSTVAQAGGVTVEESGQSPDRKITVISPAIYKAVVWQASGGGINEFYDPASDPEAKRNLGTPWGLFEFGWHGAALPKDVKPDLTKADSENNNYGCRFWPTPPYECRKLQAEGELDILEQSAAFKVIGWKGAASRTVKVDGRQVPAVAALIDGNLVCQIAANLPGAKARIELGK